MRAPRAVDVLSAAGLTLALATSALAAAPQPTGSAAPAAVSSCRSHHATTRPSDFRYDPDQPSALQIGAADAALGAAARLASSAPPKAPTFVIDVFAHVLRSQSGGGVPERRVERQVDVLNRAFAGKQSSASAPTPFRFRLADVDVTVNGRWSRMDEGTLAEERAKRALHRGGGADLNLYIGRNQSGSLGWGTQPTRLDSEPMLDGVVIARHTLPGGSGGKYSAGDAAVHETGHWLGLFHTFAGKCGARGDLIDDTPREGRPSYACATQRDTCAAAGTDPVHNFMDYSYDSCMNEFTPGQVVRMKRAWTVLRAAARLG